MANRVLVTGGNGFIGRYVVKQLRDMNYKVTIVDKTNSPFTNEIAQYNIEFVQSDLRDRSLAMEVFKNVDICVALAANSGGIGYFNKHPAEMLDDNVRIISNTFEGARIHKISKIVYISSSCAYDKSSAHPITESALELSPPPSTGYPFSKLVGEYYCKAYLQQYGLPYVIVRPFNAYGPGELPGKEPGDSHVIPDLIPKILQGQYPLEIFGDGSQTRSFTYVQDIASGIVMAMENLKALNQDFNLGHPFEIKILDLAKMLWSICGKTEHFAIKSVKPYQIDVKRRAVDVRKAKLILGWEPKVGLEDGLTETVSWLSSQTSLFPK